jgi:glucosamine--fructose-6-phosphate aminotransferase (isomerizing)
MCGITGIVSQKPFSSEFLLKRLKRLEYRGYDSYGYYNKEKLLKRVGEIIPAGEDESTIAISHTRWATHGGVTEINTHPHVSKDKEVVIVHNGIIENFQQLKKDLQNKGCEFISQTDSELVAHYFYLKLKEKDIKQAIQDFFKEVKGTFGILIMLKDKEEIYALKRDSPLVLGICKDKNILASDIYAFSDITDKAIFFENEEYAIVKKDSYEFFKSDGSKIEKQTQTFVWEQEESNKEEYEHYMLKEIKEEPAVVKRLLLSLDGEQKEKLDALINAIKESKKIFFVACGTSYHASLLGAYYFHKIGISSQTLIASEFKYYANIDEDTLIITISQSGETMDIIDALKYARKKKCKIASIVNVPYSSIERLSDLSVNSCAGQEVSVASTKSYVNQVVLLLKMAQQLGFKVNLDNVADKINFLFEQEEEIMRYAQEVSLSKDAYIIGRGLTYPVSREIALKVKEISYIHAEGMMGGELKHGTIALIEKGTPLVSLINNSDPDILANTAEVEARGANVIVITNNKEVKEQKEKCIYIKTGNDGKFAIVASIAGQLLAYYAAKALNRPIDKPRNLAKSCTVK